MDNRNDRDDPIKKIRVVEDQYGLVLFRMGLTHLMDVGVRNLDEEAVEECIHQIMDKGEDDKAQGKISVMTPEFQCSIVRCAADLALFSIWDLFAYIKKYVAIGGT